MDGMDCLLIGLLITASLYDFKYRRIPNWLIGIGLITALLYHFLSGGWTGVLFSLKGFVAGIGLLFIPFALRGIGAGDVKLLGVVGAFHGLNFVFSTFLWMALWGGLMALIIAYRDGRLGGVLINLVPANIKYAFPFTAKIAVAQTSERVVYPYALAIALGVLCTFLKGWC
ncbi:MAG: prepilin peptidase [Syntrophomonas sp.]